MSDNSNIDALEQVQLLSEFQFEPTNAHRKAKSAFWQRFGDNPICDPNDISLAIAAQFVADKRIEKWWSLPGFRQWFSNQNEFRELVESGAYQAVQTAINILSMPTNAKSAGAQISAARLMLEIAQKMPARPSPKQEAFLDERIAQMSRAELQEYIARNTPRLVNRVENNK